MSEVIGTTILNSLSTITFFQNEYLKAILIILFFYIISKLVGFIIKRFVLQLTAKTKTELDDDIVKVCYKPLTWFLFLVGIKLGVLSLRLSDRINDIVQVNFTMLMILLVMYVLIKLNHILLISWAKKFAEKTKSHLDDVLLPLIEKSIKIAILSIGFIMILGEWGVDVTGLIAGLGIAGLALGFAVKDSLSNVFGGVQLILDKAFKVGDVVKLSDGNMGVITNIGLRSTRLKTWDNEQLIVPNGGLANATIQNYIQPDLSARAVVDFGVEYGSDVEKVKRVVTDAIKKLDNVIKNDKDKGISVLFLNMGDSALEFSARFWVGRYEEKFSTREEAVCAIYKALNKSGIGIPFPTRTVYLKK